MFELALFVLCAWILGCYFVCVIGAISFMIASVTSMCGSMQDLWIVGRKPRTYSEGAVVVFDEVLDFYGAFALAVLVGPVKLFACGVRYALEYTTYGVERAVTYLSGKTSELHIAVGTN